MFGFTRAQLKADSSSSASEGDVRFAEERGSPAALGDTRSPSCGGDVGDTPRSGWETPAGEPVLPGY